MENPVTSFLRFITAVLSFLLLTKFLLIMLSSAVGKRSSHEKKIDPSLSNLIDDVIIDILTRLPPKYVLVCRCVCRNWRDLTSTIDFIDFYGRNSLPMILKDYHQVALLDGCWETAKTRSKIHDDVYSDCPQLTDLSHNGLIVDQNVYNRGSIRIFNPIYSYAVNIIVPKVRRKSYRSVYGVFFHPIHKEYCTLWRMTLSREPLNVQYMILNLESDPEWRVVLNPCNQNGRIWGIRPIIIDNNYLYWMVEPFENYDYSSESTFTCDIMEYDIRNEEFRVIPFPVPVTVTLYNFDVNLVDIDGVVSVVQVVPHTELVEVNRWTLKDHRGQSWTISHDIVSSDVYSGYGVPKVVAFRNEELVIQSSGGLYVCNLKLGTFRKFGRHYDKYVNVLSHVTSLVSLSNCNSNICMSEEDEKI